MKSILFCFLCLVVYLFAVAPVNSETLFSDNFENSEGSWTTKLGGSNLWEIADGKLKFRINTPSTFSGIISSPITQQDYIIEFDYTPISGEDKNISFRWNDNLIYPYYDIHFINADGGTGILSRYNNYEGWPKIINYNLSNNNTYHFKIVLEEKNIKVFIDDSKVYDVTDLQFNYMPYDKVGLWATTGAVYPTEVWFDNIVVRTLEESNDLNVPFLKQTAEPWQSNVYDAATLWSPLNPTINRWGCALTSATMVLQYYGITKMPDNNALNPGSVNTWLNSQPDGYIRNGLINWLALSRLSKLAKSSGLNAGFAYDALEYRRYNGYNPSQLTTDIQNNQPDILEEPGHFIVAKGINGSTFNINDPFYNRLTLNDGYSNSFTSISHYTPSNTDLSYIMLVSDQDVQVSLRDSSGNVVGEQFTQQPVSNPLDILQSSGNPVKITYLRKPSSGSYHVDVSHSQGKAYILTNYLYDQNGSVAMTEYQGAAGVNSETFDVTFDKLQSTGSSIQRIVTFQSVKNDITELSNDGLIKNNIAQRLLRLLDQIEDDVNSGNLDSANRRLSRIYDILQRERGSDISGEAYNILFNTLQELEQSFIAS